MTNIGSRVGSFVIGEPLGAGGMGEVYRARDTRLGRDVAIKVLPASVAGDASRLARFEREARVLASLNHPNIATLYGVEDAPTGPVLVMELVDGVTLADRLTLGDRLPLTEILSIARQVTAALEAAHERGIVHRDLKPANIVVRPDGTVTVLDFGLAKALDTADAAPDALAATATLTDVSGGIGPGTPAYMSPEQARGLPIGKRTDIWAFGCVLYELLTGQRPFAGDRTSEVVARILERDPDFSLLPPDTPAAIRRLLRRCLEKDPQRRLRDMGDGFLELEEAATASTHAAHDLPSQRDSIRARRVMLASTLAVAVIGLSGLMLYGRQSLVVPAAVRFSILPPDRGRFLTPLITGSAAPVGGTISPDGRMIAYTAADASGKILLWVRRLDSLDATPLAGTDDAALPFWSPDSRSLAFFGVGTLKRVDIEDGTVQELSDVARGRGGTWNRNGIIVFAPALSSGLSRISAAGGQPQTLTTLDPGELSHRFPNFLPDGRHFLYYVEDSHAGNSGVFVADLEGRSPRRVLTADSAAAYGAPRHVVFVRQGTLFAQPFDLGTLDLTGEPVALARAVPSDGGAPAFSVSSTGILTYRSGAAEDQQFAWFDRTGTLLDLVGPPGSYRGMDLSPDGQRIAVHRHDGSGGDIWVFEPRGTTTRVTFDPEYDNSSPVWSPDGSRIAFGSLRGGKWGLYHTRANGTGGDELLVESELPKIPSSWSPDGRALVYWLFSGSSPAASRPGGAVDTWWVRLTGLIRPEPLISTRFYEGHAQVSPDGRWIAYASRESGDMQVYVRPFPSGDDVWPVSTDGGVTPRWGRDGKELFYVTAYDNGRLMAVPVRREGDSFVPGTPRELFSVGMATPPHSTAINVYHTYAVAPDSRRFLIPRPVSMLRGDGASTPITVVLNWPALLERPATP